ncbi:uncharacterized protein NECHADRAFT_75871 [Fusarium vanettenii 77-13-4]|uniref:Uncharacterized protein n=1 Tax=Fusarium vanettenii (strain ATCC MYA-4622 / CBS 123669 / FGSC 9596 / NRRL 45880 / 77-13-4) TaxID=660122 RepID=C7Z5U4_FUSV7|nr:uncharacterized protein NECHADRAFT_75871 [Fusarium vanettenii 77-13-4]EEU40012.1 predicted protein [Fusarium vanettenii 77-13-4]
MGWDKSALEQVSHNTTVFAKIGGEAAYVLSDTCNATAEATTYLWDPDWQTVLVAKKGSLTESVVTGTYDNFLTITDGKSVNSTWSVEHRSSPRRRYRRPPSPPRPKRLKPRQRLPWQLLQQPVRSLHPTTTNITLRARHTATSTRRRKVAKLLLPKSAKIDP